MYLSLKAVQWFTICGMCPPIVKLYGGIIISKLLMSFLPILAVIMRGHRTVIEHSEHGQSIL